MRKLGIIGLTMVASLIAAAIAIAQTPAAVVTLDGSVASEGPAKNGNLKLAFAVNAESKSTFDTIKLTIPNGVKLSGKGFKTCSDDKVNQTGEESCPSGSQVGTGTARAVLPDGTVLNFTMKIYVAGTNELTLSLTTDLFQIAIPAQISGQFVNATVPGRVQQPVGGLYAYVTNVAVDIGPSKTTVKKTTFIKKKVPGKKKRKRVKKIVKVPAYVVTINSCPGNTRTYGVALHLVPNPSPPADDTIGATRSGPCSSR